MADNVIIKIDGDDSGFRKALEGIGKTTKAGMADVKAGIDLATAAVQKLSSVAKKGLDYNATIEQMQTSFEVMTGSAEKAAEVVERLRLMGAETPFETTDLVNTTQLLMQYGFTADDAIDKMRMLGDIAQGNTEAMNSIAMGYAQMSSAGKVNLQDIKQMINGGFNPLQEISERTGESMASLYDRISKGTLTIDEITQSMVNATSEGGKFFQSMEKQSQTLNGQLSTLKDNTDQLLGSLTEGFSAEMRDELLPLANNMIGELQEAFSTHGTQGLVDAATDMIPRLLNMMTGEFEKGVEAVGKWLPKGAQALMKSVPGALRSAGKIAPEITTIFFELASTIITDLVAMLPELAPVIVEGFVNTAEAALKGSLDAIGAIFLGVEKAFHQGQTKVASIWVDNEQIAKYNFDVEVDVDETDINEKIESAKGAVEDVLSGIEGVDASEIADCIISGDVTAALEAALISAGVDPKSAKAVAYGIETSQKTISEAIASLNLPEEVAQKIKDMAENGASAGELTEYIVSLGVDESVAGETAQTITTAGGKVNAAIADLPDDIEESINGLAFDGDQETLVAALQVLGLNTEDIQTVLDSYTETSGLLSSGITGIFDNIKTTLTDGLPDTEEVISGLEEDVREWARAAYDKIESWYNSEVASLKESGKTGSEYDAALLDVETKANEMRASVQEAEVGAIGFMNSMAGKSTGYVQQHIGELNDIEEKCTEVSAEIDALTAKMNSVGAAAFDVVRSGANADETTISQAIAFKVTEFKIDTQSAEDAYAAARDELTQKLSKGEISKDTYNTELETAAGKRDRDIAAAKQAYESALSQIFSGIAESEGIENHSAELAEKFGLSETLLKVKEGLSETGLVGDQLGQEMTNKLAEYMQIDPEILKNMPVDTAKGALSDWAAQLYTDATSSITELDNSKVAATYAKALEDGLLAGTSFDTSNAGEQIKTLLVGIYKDGASVAKPSIAQSGAELGKASTSQMSDASGARAAGNETVNGLDSALARAESRAYKRGQAAGRAFASGYKAEQVIQSPSKVMMRLGEYSGEGLEIGLRNSMARAVLVAKQMSGQIVTAADISQSMRVANMPNLQQEIISANEQNKTPVYLDGYKIAEIQGYNNSTTLAWNNTRAAKGVGGR